MQKEKMIELMDEAIFLTAEIECSKCRKKEVLEFISDSIDAADSFYDYGWRIINEEPVCKNCRNKKSQSVNKQ